MIGRDAAMYKACEVGSGSAIARSLRCRRANDTDTCLLVRHSGVARRSSPIDGKTPELYVVSRSGDVAEWLKAAVC
jgi:hypothetical protein